MLTGEPLFPGDSDIDQLYHIIKCFGKYRYTLFVHSLVNGLAGDIGWLRDLDRRNSSPSSVMKCDNLLRCIIRKGDDWLWR